jgi:uncharacterized membrane protein
MKNKPSRQVLRARSRAGLSTPQRQRGAAAVFAAAAIVAMLISMLLAINIGQLYYAQRDLQRQATLAALAGAQVGSGCGNGGVPASLAIVTTAVTASLVNNGTKDSGALLSKIGTEEPVELGWVNGTSGQTITDDSGNTIKVPVPLDGLQHFRLLTKTEGDSHINAVRVNLAADSPSVIGGFFAMAPIKLHASATAKQQIVAGFGLGTSLATLDNGALNQLLSALLGTKVSLTLASYNGLAAAQVNLGSLMVAAGVTDLNSLLSLQTTLPGALQIVGNALTQVGGATSGLAGGVVTGLAGQSYSGSNPTQNYFGQIFNNVGGALNPGVNDVLSAVPFIDGVNLLEALGQAANKGGSIALPVTADLPLGLGGLGVFLKIIDPQKFAVGPAGFDPPGDVNGRPLTQAKSAQVVLQLRLQLNVLSLVGVNLAIDAGVANGQSILTKLTCPSVSSPKPQATIQTTTSLLTVYLGTFTGSPTANPPADPSTGYALNVLGLVKLKATASNIPYAGATQTQTGSAPPVNSFPAIASATPLTTAINTLLSSNLSLEIISPLFSIPIGSIVSALLSPITKLLDTILAPLLQLLGIGVGNSSVVLEGINPATPVIANTALPGTPES